MGLYACAWRSNRWPSIKTRCVAALLSGGFLTANAQPTHLLKQAIAALDQEDVPRAQQLLDQAALETDDSKKSSQIWYFRGVAHDKLLRQQLATIRATSEKLHACLEAYRNAIQLALPETAYSVFSVTNLDRLKVYLRNRGVRYAKRGNWEAAARQFLCGLEIDSADADLHLYAAIAFQHTKDQSEALTHFRRYTALIAPGTPDLEVYCAMATLIKDVEEDSAASMSLLQEALRSHPWKADVVFEQVAHCRDASVPNTIDASTWLSSQDKPTALNAYQRGCWYRTQGRLDEALEAYAQATEQSSRNKAALCLQQGIAHYEWVVQKLRESAKEGQAPPHTSCLTHLRLARQQLQEALELGCDRALPYLDNLSRAFDASHTSS